MQWQLMHIKCATRLRHIPMKSCLPP